MAQDRDIESEKKLDQKIKIHTVIIDTIRKHNDKQDTEIRRLKREIQISLQKTRVIQYRLSKIS